MSALRRYGARRRARYQASRERGQLHAAVARRAWRRPRPAPPSRCASTRSRRRGAGTSRSAGAGRGGTHRGRGAGGACRRTRGARASRRRVDRRSIDRPGRDRARSRAASRPSAQPGIAQASKRSASGSGVVRSTTSVRNPSRPSDPRTSWRRSGPAAEAGNGGRSREPAGASRTPPANSCSIRPRPRLRIPEPRAATQPPIVASSNDCGSWPTVRPCDARASASAGPGRPGACRHEAGSARRWRSRRRAAQGRR